MTELNDVRIEIPDTVDTHEETLTVGDLIEFLKKQPRDAKIVWSGVLGNRLILVCPTPPEPRKYLYVCEATGPKALDGTAHQPTPQSCLHVNRGTDHE